MLGNLKKKQKKYSDKNKVISYLPTPVFLLLHLFLTIYVQVLEQTASRWSVKDQDFAVRSGETINAEAAKCACT